MSRGVHCWVYLLYLKPLVEFKDGWVVLLLIFTTSLPFIWDWLRLFKCGCYFQHAPSLISPNSCKNMPCSQRVKQSSGVPHYELKKHKQYFILLSIRVKQLCWHRKVMKKQVCLHPFFLLANLKYIYLYCHSINCHWFWKRKNLT